MGKRRIKSEKVSFRKKIGLIKDLAGQVEALKESIQPRDWNLGKQPTFEGESDVSLSSLSPVRILPEETNYELSALDPESFLPKFGEDV